MVAPVNLITIHHEGGGAPSDNVQRFSEGGYCYGIGITRFERFRSPHENWATLNFNHRDLTICYSGDRHTGYPITDTDLVLTCGAFMDCFGRGEVTAGAEVRAHRNSPGSATACPGDLTMARWNEVVAACRPTVLPAPTPEPPVAEDADMLAIAVANPKAADNQQPYGLLDAPNRKILSYWGFRIAWDGQTGDAAWTGSADPRMFVVPGSAPLATWDVLSSANDGQTRRFCVYGLNGAEYIGTAHG